MFLGIFSEKVQTAHITSTYSLVILKGSQLVEERQHILLTSLLRTAEEF